MDVINISKVALTRNDHCGNRPRRAGTAGTRSAMLLLAAVAALTGARAVRADGAVVAWGKNEFGQCITPPGIGAVNAIAGGAVHTVALKDDGAVVAWGWNYWGQCITPPGLGVVTAIAAGGAHTVVLKADGAVVAWGNNDYDQCDTPLGIGVVTAITAGRGHTVALKADGAVRAWGDNQFGQCDTPPGLWDVTAITAGSGYHTVALKANGGVRAWGRNDYGQCTAPVGLGVVTAIAAGFYHTVALKADGAVVAWGRNDYGQCFTPPGLGVVTAIAAGWSHTIALKPNGAVVAWGDNQFGQCTTPPGIGPVTAIASGGSHTVALMQGDECSTASTAQIGTNIVNIALMTPSADTPENGSCSALGWNSSQPDAWFVYHAPADGVLYAVFCNSNYDTSVVVYQGSVGGSCDNLVRIGCADDECWPTGSGYQSAITNLAVSEGPVYIRIGGYFSPVETSVGIAEFDLTFIGADECETAATAVLGMNSISTSDLTPSANPPEDGMCSQLDWDKSKDAWFVYDAPTGGLLSAEFCESTYDTSVVIYQGTCSALTRIGCGDDECSPGGGLYQSRILDLPVAAGLVFIRIGGWHGATGLANFELSFSTCRTDFNGDGVTDSSDMASLLSNWGNSSGDGDVDSDGVVGSADLAILLNAWGPC